MSELEDKIRYFIAAEAARLGIAAAACMPLPPERLLAGVTPVLGAGYSEYLMKSWASRMNPAATFPFARSLVMFAIPFASLPPVKGFIPATDREEFKGLVAGYAAARLDYHACGRRILAEFADSLKKLIGREFRTEFCVDTAPLAEKSLGAIAGLGRTGLNTCLLVQGGGSGCFISSMLCDLELPHFVFTDADGLEGGEDKEDEACGRCRLCIGSCPNGVFNGNPGKFNVGDCISFLTTEKRGCLNPVERKKIGEWIFGCDCCTRNCPGSRIPDAYPADIEWILLASQKNLREAVQGTALEHAGTTMLRRNAVAVLGNKLTADSRRLLEGFAKKTRSGLLRKTVADLGN